MAILGLFVAMMTQVFTRGDDQRRFDETRMRMQEIKKAILGSEGAYANGQRQFVGYVVDMGGLPEVFDINIDDPTHTGAPVRSIQQPKGLWNDDPDDDGTSFDPWQYQGDDDSRIWCGWRGPYIEIPPIGVLRDGWGNAFIFFKDSVSADTCAEINDRITSLGGLHSEDKAIISLGADNACGGSDFAEDIIKIIRRTEYMAPVAGKRVDSSITEVKIYYPDKGKEQSKSISVFENDYFRFESTVPNIDIPIGVRSIQVTGGSGKLYVFTVEPTGNWLGVLN